MTKNKKKKKKNKPKKKFLKKNLKTNKGKLEKESAARVTKGGEQKVEIVKIIYAVICIHGLSTNLIG